ncbi:MAG: hypothetical protein HC895_08690 [Leptolyngbyaceae cyanobacterium SM1_3_5]|nr:hypothetical protein [Leptolyngbyaceae cyanobacterium SM1_3_5]
MDQLRELFRRMLSPDVYHLPMQVIIDRIIDAYYDELLSQPGYRTVLLEYYLSPKATAIIDNVNREIQPFFEALFAARAPDMELEQRKLIAMVTVEASCVLEFVSSEADDTLRIKLRLEEKRLLAAYLHTYFPDS